MRLIPCPKCRGCLELVGGGMGLIATETYSERGLVIRCLNCAWYDYIFEQACLRTSIAQVIAEMTKSKGRRAPRPHRTLNQEDQIYGNP